MRTLTRHLQLQVAGRFGLLLLIFLMVLVGGQLASLINRGAPPETLLPVAMFMALLALPMALPMALASAVLVVLGAMRRDGELQALATAGVDPVKAAFRLWPFVVAGMLLSALLWHAVMPAAMKGMRNHAASIFQAMIAQRVAAMKPVWSNDGVSAWAGQVEGQELRDMFLIRKDQDSDGFTAMFAPRGEWDLGPNGVRFDLKDVRLYHHQGNQVAVVDSPVWSAAINPEDRGGKLNREPDTMSTRRVWATLKAEREAGQNRGTECAQYNNARLTLHLRLWMPIATACFCLFAAGFALAFGAAESLVAVGVVAVAVAVAVYPAIGFVKTGTNHQQMDPGILLWLPGLTLAGLGWFMLHKPEKAREAVTMPWWWLHTHLKMWLRRLARRLR